MRICHLGRQPSEYSSESAHERWKLISAELRRRGHEIIEEELGATHTLRAWMSFLLGSVKWIFRYSRLNADVVIADDIEAAFAAGLARHIFGGAMVLDFAKDYFSRVRGRGFRFRAALVWLMERVVPLWADLVIAGDYQKKHFVQSVGMPPNRIAYIPSPVNCSVFQPGGEVRRGMLLFVGDLESYNRVRILVRALSLLKAKEPDLELWLAGKGRAERKLRQLVANLDMKERVRFGGTSEEETVELFQAAELVLCTVADASNLRLYQALGCGKPVIVPNGSSRKIGIPDEEVPSDCVLKVEPTPEGFARAISLLRAGPMAAEFFGECGRRLVTERCDLDRITTGYERVMIAAGKGESLETESPELPLNT